MPTKAPGHSDATSHLMFGEREGVREIPKPLLLGELSQELRSLLWAIVYESLKQSEYMSGFVYFGHPWDKILSRWHVAVLHRPADEFSSLKKKLLEPLKNLFFEDTYVEVFEFLEFVMKSRECPEGFSKAVSLALKNTQAAYIVVENQYIFPTATEEEAVAVESAMHNLQNKTFSGAKTHLLKAGSELNRGNFAESIRESIHAVESVSRAIVPEAKTLAPALNALESRSQLHKALKTGFGALYGFTCDEQGIRHALLDRDEADVDRESAIFMLGACASFASYLANKGRQAGLIK